MYSLVRFLFLLDLTQLIQIKEEFKRMTKLYQALYPYLLTVVVTMAAMGYEFAKIPQTGFWMFG